MAFSLTFNSILENNIRHVYSGMPVQMSYRHSTEYPNMDQLRQKRENQQLKDFVLRTSEYQANYNCLIPRAPAFRLLSRHQVPACCSLSLPASFSQFLSVFLCPFLIVLKRPDAVDGMFCLYIGLSNLPLSVSVCVCVCARARVCVCVCVCVSVCV